MAYFFQWDAINKKWVYSTTGGAPFSDVVDNPTIETLVGNGISAPAVSASGKCRLYFDASTKRLRISEDGAAYKDITPPLTTKGDLLSYDTGVNRLAVGTNGYVLEADSAQSLGVKWAAKTPLTTKGDVQVYGSAVDRLPVGANNTFLVADSTESLGVKWASPYACRLTHSAAQTIANTTITSLTFDTEITDTGGLHSTSTNPTRITIPVSGWWLLSANWSWAYSAGGTYRYAYVKVNNTKYIVVNLQQVIASGQGQTHNFSALTYLSANDYVEIQAHQDSGGNLNVNTDLTHEYTPIFSAALLFRS